MSFKQLATISVSCVAAAIFLAGAGWMMLGRGDQGPGDAAVQIIPPVNVPPEVETVPATDPEGGVLPASTPSHDKIAVYITGAVVNPGVYSVAPTQRLEHVLSLAGGPSEDADLDRVNLAAYVSDAAHYKVPSIKQPETGAGQTPNDSEVPTEEDAGRCTVPININAADTGCLQSLPGIGSVRAASIVAHRERVAHFATAQDITSVSGIGEGIYLRIEDMITVGPR